MYSDDSVFGGNCWVVWLGLFAGLLDFISAVFKVVCVGLL